MKWWMEHKSQDAPDSIFRDDKSFERFLAAGMALPEHDHTVRDREQKESERVSRRAETRAFLERTTGKRTAQMFQKLAPLKEQINTHSWDAFMAPLLYVDVINGTVIIFSDDALWVRDHYADRIASTLGHPVQIVDDLP